MEELACPIAGITTTLHHCLLFVRQLSQHAAALRHWQPGKTSSCNVSMIPCLSHPWLPQKMVWGGLPLVAVLICLVPDALFVAEELDAVLLNQLPTAHHLAMGLLLLRASCLFHGHDAQVAD